MVIFFLSIIAFAGSFYILSQNNSIDTRFAPTYGSALRMIFEMTQGNFDTTSFGEVGVGLVYFFFVISSIFLLIMMLNLLIAVIALIFDSQQQI